MIKIPNKRELYLIALNHFFDIEFEKFMKIDKYFTKEPHLTIRKTTAIWRIENFSLGSALKKWTDVPRKQYAWLKKVFKKGRWKKGRWSGSINR